MRQSLRASYDESLSATYGESSSGILSSRAYTPDDYHPRPLYRYIDSGLIYRELVARGGIGRLTLLVSPDSLQANYRIIINDPL